ncbi:RNA polymerase II transcription elongation factor-domain-containing protein [Emericellopsis atlantica]|uniref:RNA polymerase II transcription elongation factor-domain-containing protein n=1 Tax=Emericellopsis atlantica TaxID=2614577 RepID=A0A9P8CTY6_9HYPO|nr:RNA polymerase II transcription elongation factor-domain-containing protein [Emericellopsis atlantica]KAG9258660.1 RNA polymerase II transcription elongation factor-domain-containing protein [Emericellopsis atlantica]
MAGLIDPTKTGNYPVVLSDRLLGKEHNEIFTGVRYNHKPSGISESSTARVKPSIAGQTSSYDLTISESDGTYAYQGTRSVGDGRYVMYFDPRREVFVLDRLDSTFHMNLTRMPGNSDASSLERRHPQIKAADTAPKKPEAKPKAKAKPRAKSPPPRKKEPAARKPERKAKNIDLALPPAAAAAAAAAAESKRKKAPEEDEDEEEEEDDPLQVEYPDGSGPKAKGRGFSPAVTSVRPFDEFMDRRESEADDADGESMDEEEDFKLPSPVKQPQQSGYASDHHEEGGAAEGDTQQSLEDELEKDLEEAFEMEMAEGSGEAEPQQDDESDISEED